MSAFPSTRWSLVLTAVEGSADAASDALATLCQAYWYPLYAYVRRAGHSADDSKDLTQDFFHRLLADDLLARADREKGRFRTFLLTCLMRFLSHERDKRFAEKRGGKAIMLSIDAEAAEEHYRFEPVDSVTPEMLYERAWATALLERARVRLEQEYGAAGKETVFARLQPLLQGVKEPAGLAGVAAELGKSEAAVKMEAMRLRQRYRALVMNEVRDTVVKPEEAEDEFLHLLRLLAGN